MKRCPKCGLQASDAAPSCVDCGYQWAGVPPPVVHNSLPKSSTIEQKIIGITVGIGILAIPIFGIMFKEQHDSKERAKKEQIENERQAKQAQRQAKQAQQQAELEAKREAKIQAEGGHFPQKRFDGTAYPIRDWMRANLNDPGSAEVVGAGPLQRDSEIKGVSFSQCEFGPKTDLARLS